MSTASRTQIDTVVLSTQHQPDITHEQIKEAVIEEIVKPVLPKNMLKRRHQVSDQSDRPLRDRRTAWATPA